MIRESNFFQRPNKKFKGESKTINNRKKGVENIANRSGQSLAMLLGEISPKINTTTVTTAVDTVAARSASAISFKNSMVPMDAKAMFTILFPMRMVDNSLSYPSAKIRVFSAFLLPFSAKAFRRVLFRQEKAVSVAEVTSVAKAAALVAVHPRSEAVYPHQFRVTTMQAERHLSQ